jgi:hypothetical protein
VTDHARRYAVLRPAPELPPGFLPPDLDGRWYDLDQTTHLLEGSGDAVAVATDRFERRDSDGATARVFEVRP